ncbi:erythromycin esterase family protein [Pseudolysinimonas sp.]|uniref:erythromycin esterase family protein n=1 Tax=Pseudolysinimonas sp. TaxID=2680009 RepID=UPI003F7ECB88
MFARGAGPLGRIADLDGLARRAESARFVAIGDASHGTEEFYAWRAVLTRRLIEQQRISWIGVEGDWPDCWRIDRWLRGIEHRGEDARSVLARFERWPTWLWANTAVADFLDWLHAENLRRSAGDRVGFYGLDVYSLWDSMRRVADWLAVNSPDDLPAAVEAWRCFLPSYQDPERYALRTRVVPASCEREVVDLLARTRRDALAGDWAAFDAAQNAEVAAAAEHYYRVMMGGDRASWNIRDVHMADTVGRLSTYFGPGSRGVVWAHNTHVGDARATDMSTAGLLNIGQLLRERYGRGQVVLIGTATHRGTVLAAPRWGGEPRVYDVPPASRGSHEDNLHRHFARDVVLVFDEARDGYDEWRGHRAIGVVYDPRRESGNFVPTLLDDRYDALIWIEATQAITPIRREPGPAGPERETEPTGF